MFFLIACMTWVWPPQQWPPGWPYIYTSEFQPASLHLPRASILERGPDESPWLKNITRHESCSVIVGGYSSLYMATQNAIHWNPKCLLNILGPILPPKVNYRTLIPKHEWNFCHILVLSLHLSDSWAQWNNNDKTLNNKTYGLYWLITPHSEVFFVVSQWQLLIGTIYTWVITPVTD